MRTHVIRAFITPHLAMVVGLVGLTVLSGCSEESQGTTTGEVGELYSIGSIIQNPEGRTLLVQTLQSLDEDINNDNALEFSGNARHWAHGGAVYIGLAEEPTIEKYVPDAGGKLVSSGRVSFLSHGLTSVPAGQVFISDTKAYLFAEGQYRVIVWNPSTMEIAGEIDLSMLKKDDFNIELWTASLAGDRVYVPLRYVNFNAKEIFHQVSVVQIDAAADKVVGVAHDDRCVGASTPAVTDDGTVYVLADGRSYLAQVYAVEKKETPPANCILRIRPGETSFDPDFFVSVPSIAGGRDVVTSLWYVRDGVGYAKMYYPEQLEPGADTSGFQFWFNPAFKLWRIQLGDQVSAEEVNGAPFSMIAFGGASIGGSLFLGETQDAKTCTVYAMDPDKNQAEPRFEMQGAMRDLYRLR